MVAFLAASLTLLVPLRPLAAPHLVEPSGRTHLVMPTPVSGPRSVQSSICWRSASLSDSRCARSGAVIAAVRSAQDDDGATMKRADLPSGEELTVASFLGGAACAFVWRHILGGSAVFGALIGVLITRRIAYQPTKAGAYVREAGWATHKQYLALRARSKAASEWAMTEAHQLGLPTPSELGSKLLQLMRKAVAEVKRRDQESGFSQRIRARLAPVTSRLRRPFDWVAAKWSSPSVQRQISNTGIPDAFRRFRQRAEERQQAEMRRRAEGA